MIKLAILQALTATAATMLVSPHTVTAASEDIKYDPDVERAALDENREKWANYSGGTSNYNYQFERSCFCPEEYRGPFNIQVRLGEITAATYTSGKSVDSDLLPGLPTIEGVFTQIEDALERQYEDIQVTYNADGGYPERVFYDTSSMIADDEMVYTVGSVELLPSLEL